MRKQGVVSVLTLAFGVITLTVAGQAPDPWLGTWKVNFAKSTYSPGPPPPTPTAALVSTWVSLGGGQFKQSQDGVDAKGQKTHQEVTLRFDGADYPFVGAAQPTTRSYKRLDARTFEYVVKVNGKVTSTNIVAVAPDGKTRTITSTGTNAQGQAFKNVQLWEKQ